jgi:hypothetical protein
MAVIAKNQTESDVTLTDLAAPGSVVPASGSLDLLVDNTFVEIQNSGQLKTLIAAGTLLLNDGTNDLDLVTSLAFVEHPSGFPKTSGGVPVHTLLQRSVDGVPLVAQQRLILGQKEFLRTDNGAALMNIDGRPAGIPAVVWNGTGVGDTGGDWAVSGTGSETVGSTHTGTSGWDTGVMSLGNFFDFDNGTLVDVANAYSQLRFWIQPKAWPVRSRLEVGFLDDSGALVGKWRRVETYTANMDLDTWQQVFIPVADFSLTSSVQKLQFRANKTNGQHFFLDNVELVPAGGAGPYCFRVAAPDASTRLHVSMVVIVVAAPSVGWNPSSFANIAGGLTGGLLVRQRRLSDGEIIWRLNSKNNIDLFGRFHPQDDITFANGDLLVGFMIKPGKASVTATDDEVLEIVVCDDLSSLSELRGYAHYGTEVAT